MNLFIKPLLGRIINSIKITQVNRLMFFTLLFLGGSKSYSQVFAPVGAKWTYEEFGPRGYGFIVATQFRVEKDTIIDDRYCTILTRHTLDETGIG